MFFGIVLISFRSACLYVYGCGFVCVVEWVYDIRVLGFIFMLFFVFRGCIDVICCVFFFLVIVGYVVVGIIGEWRRGRDLGGLGWGVSYSFWGRSGVGVETW